MKLFSTALLALSLLACAGVGDAGPDIRVVNLEGLDAALEEHRGKGVLLNFWAIWCDPCVAELPELVETARAFRHRDGVVVGVSYDLMIPGATRDGVMPKMREFVKERDLDIPVLIYDAPDYDAINERFGLPGQVPVTLAIDARGAIVDRQEGKAGKDRFVAMMEKALGR